MNRETLKRYRAAELEILQLERERLYWRSRAGKCVSNATSPGILSGNVVQVPINVSTNVCGNSLGLLGGLSPSAGNICINR